MRPQSLTRDHCIIRIHIRLHHFYALKSNLHILGVTARLLFLFRPHGQNRPEILDQVRQLIQDKHNLLPQGKTFRLRILKVYIGRATDHFQELFIAHVEYFPFRRSEQVDTGRKRHCIAVHSVEFVKFDRKVRG